MSDYRALDDLRRQDDVVLASLDKRLALLEQSGRLQADAADARGRSLETLINSLGTKLDSATERWQAVTAEPAASPAGRALVASMAQLRETVDEHEALVQQMSGALKFARLAFGTSILAGFVSFVQLAVAALRASA